MRYVKIKLSNKSLKKLVLNELVSQKILSNDVIEKIKSLDKGNLSLVKNIQYEVGEYIKNAFSGATIETMEQYDNDIHVTYLKNNDYHTVIIPKQLLSKTVIDEVRVTYKEYEFIERELIKDLYTSKELDELKSNEILLKVKKWKFQTIL